MSRRTLFLDVAQVPLDNNASERRLRTPVQGRKNIFLGTGADWSAMLAAMAWSIFATARQNLDTGPMGWQTLYTVH